MSKLVDLLSIEQRQIYDAALLGENILVTGGAGTGKSFLLKALREAFKKLPVCASTGIAAVQVGGTTIHSWAQLGLAEDPADVIANRIIDQHGAVYKRIKKCKQLALDEVSMIHGDTLDLIDQVFRRVRDRNEPFGGIQVILFGDFLQLPPVSREKEQKFAFQSRVWAEANIKVKVLTKVFRQQDEAFANVLNQIRVGNLTPEVRALLKSRYQQPDFDPEIEPVIVHTHNVDVEGENNRRLAKIEGKLKTYTAHDWGSSASALQTIQRNCLAPQELQLKIGAQVMLLQNLDPLSGLANGTIGRIAGFSKAMDLPLVKFKCRKEPVEIKEFEWSIRDHEGVIAERRQIPLRLAWAITTHKSQGMTLDKIRVYLAKVFEKGQAYVALSRARTLDGLFIESTSEGCIQAHPAAVRFYETATQL